MAKGVPFQLFDQDRHNLALGRLVRDSTEYDYALHMLLWSIQGMDTDNGLCVTQHMSNGTIESAIKSSLAIRDIPQDAKRETKELINRGVTLRNQRNTVVHSIIVKRADTLTDKNLATVMSIRARESLTIKPVDITPEAVESIAMEMRHYAARLQSLMRAHFPQPWHETHFAPLPKNQYPKTQEKLTVPDRPKPSSQ